MTDNELGKNFFTFTNRGWSNPTKWEDLPKHTQYLWIQRALKAKKEYDKDILHE
jgi:hypothetical protein